MLSQQEQLLVQQLKTFGYPNADDNVRVKPYVLYDTLTISSGTQAYYYFVNSTLDIYKRNRVFPISANEIIWINEIALQLLSDRFLIGTNELQILTNSCLTISVDDRIKLKVPLAEILNFNFTLNQDAAASSQSLTFSNNISRKRKLLFPIIINSSSNVQVKLDLSSAAATVLNNIDLKLELRGIKFDKITPFEYDPVKGNKVERLSFTIYDTILYNQSTEVYDIFSTQNKDNNLYSKIFPLGDKETFSIENIELFFTTRAETGTYTTMPKPLTLYNTLSKSVIKINVDDIEFLNTMNKDLITLFVYDYVGTANSVGCYFSNLGYTLDTPITIPAASRTKVSLNIPINTMLKNTDYFTVMLKGTLQRIVA